VACLVGPVLDNLRLMTELDEALYHKIGKAFLPFEYGFSGEGRHQVLIPWVNGGKAMRLTTFGTHELKLWREETDAQRNQK
jgi:hypothetical protein